uniref:RNA binding motif protein X-linked 2 n=1 Tax=Callithrix jacchus TaxID=9483 RepID=A0A8I3WZH4_CALJA
GRSSESPGVVRWGWGGRESAVYRGGRGSVTRTVRPLVLLSLSSCPVALTCLLSSSLHIPPPCSPLTKVKLINELNEREVQLGVADKVSWHSEYKDSAWIFLGGLPYELTEGDIICVFSQTAVSSMLHNCCTVLLPATRDALSTTLPQQSWGDITIQDYFSYFCSASFSDMKLKPGTVSANLIFSSFEGIFLV